MLCQEDVMNEPQDKDKSHDPISPGTVIERARKAIAAIQTARRSKLLVLISHRSLGLEAALSINSMMRKMGKTGDLDNLDVLLESGGGDLDSAYKILQILKSHAKRVTVVVPFHAKSAAALIALGADRLQMCRAGELGPIDPQVLDPDSGMMVPALSIKNAMDFINEAANPIVAASLADKISPMLMGAYRNAEAASKQCLNEIFTAKKFDSKRREELVGVFTEDLLSHGYPVSRDFLKEHGIPVAKLKEGEEELFADLHEMWLEYCVSTYASDREQSGQMFILQNSETALVKLGDIMIRDVE